MAVDLGEIHVLCVDDDHDHLELVEAYLERNDSLTVSTATGADEALAALADAAADTTDVDPVDCVVSDYEMPGGDGIDLLRRVREAHGDLPFILFTGKGSEAVAADAVQAGVDSYLQKSGPETYDLLANQVRQQVAQYRAQQATERYETIIEALGDAVYVTDEQGRFVYTNEAFSELTGYTSDELRGEHPSIIKSSESVATIEASLRQILRGDGPNAAISEIEIEPRDGDPIPCEDHLGVLPADDGAYRGSVGTLRDVSDRVRRERRLRRERTRAAVLFEDSPTPIARLQFVDETPIVKAVNAAFEETFGYLEPEVVDEPLDAFIVSGADQHSADEFNRRVAAGETVTAEIERQTVDGPRQFLLQAAAVETDRGTEGYAMYVDVTDRTRRERALRDRVREFEGFGEVIAHDLRNQLNVALGQLALAREDGPDGSLDTVERALGRMDELIGELTDVMRSGSIVDESTDVDLAELGREVWEAVAGDPDRLTVADTEMPIRADPQALKRLFENLFQNSRQHAGPDVTVRVGLLPDGFYVEDDGPGIPAAERTEVFVPGYSTAEGRSGLGLVSVRQIAAGHGWEVQLAESPEGGLRVEFLDVETR